MEEVRKLEDTFTRRGWKFSLIKRGEKAIMFKVTKHGIPNCQMIEVWQLKVRKASVINIDGKEPKSVPAREAMPSDEDFPYWAHQYLSTHFKGGVEEMEARAEKTFQEYEDGIRPKLIEHLHNREDDDKPLKEI